MISTRSYDAVSLVIDGNRVVHAAAEDVEIGSSIYYITNASGDWARERVLEGHATAQAATAFWSPMIGQDTDGSLSIAFQFVAGAYPDDRGYWQQDIPTYLIRNRSREWSDPVEIGRGDAPSVVVREGAVYFAAQEPFVGDRPLECVGGKFALTYRTNVTGEWRSQEVDNNGLSARLALTADGLPRILFSGTNYRCASDSTIGPGLVYATAPTSSGQFTQEELPGTPYEEAIALGLDADERSHILFFRLTEFDDEFGELWYAFRDEEGWSQYERALRRVRPMHAVLDDDGFFHVLARERGGLLYATNRGGGWQSTQLWRDRAQYRFATGTLAVDGEGRPHVLLAAVVGRESREHQLWYTVGPRP